MLCKPYRKFAQENAMQKARAENTADNFSLAQRRYAKRIALRARGWSFSNLSGPEGAAGVCRGMKELQESVAA